MTLKRMKKAFCFTGFGQKKNSPTAFKADVTVRPNNITIEDIYKERNAIRKQ